MSYVLDTNILIAALNSRKAVIDRLDLLLPGEVLLPAMALAELRFGALSSQRVTENLARVAQLVERLVFIPIERSIVERFGEIKADLRKRGIAKSDPDLLIAATALEEESILVTDDGALLDGSISGLKAENWLSLPSS